CCARFVLQIPWTIQQARLPGPRPPSRASNLQQQPLFKTDKISLRTTAWYRKSHFTFSDVHAAVRQRIWAVSKFSTSPLTSQVDNLKARIRYLEQLLTEAVA
ncbi:MAG: hypothetical protein AAGL17_23980, partial [Cyanobacteria bacterium J06576_12]